MLICLFGVGCSLRLDCGLLFDCFHLYFGLSLGLECGFVDLVALVVLVLLFYCLCFDGCRLIGFCVAWVVVVLLFSFAGVVRFDGCGAC